MLVLCLKVAAGIAVYVVGVLLVARFCGTNTIVEEREERAKEKSTMV